MVIIDIHKEMKISIPYRSNNGKEKNLQIAAKKILHYGEHNIKFIH